MKLLDGRSPAGLLLLAGILLATLTEAIASSVLAFGRVEIMGTAHATPDEFAWLDVGYIAGKLVGFLLAPWLLSRLAPRNLLVAASVLMGVACAACAGSSELLPLSTWRVLQGLAGGVLLVAGQATLFVLFPRSQQAVLQALFAMASVVAPAALAPALSGWLIDSQSWPWSFLAVVPLACAASGLLLGGGAWHLGLAPRPGDWPGTLLAAIALGCAAWVLSQGSRWDWFEEPRVLWLSALGLASLFACLALQCFRPGLLEVGLFRCSDFSFAFIVSFVAGAALFGSAFLIPAFALSLLDFTPMAAGALLLPGALPFIAALLLTAWLVRGRGLAPFATVPVGILLIMAAMWLLAGSSRDSGADDMQAAVLLRGLGLGFLFLSITLIAFSQLDRDRLASGIALFNIGRQLGGLIGVAGLQTLIDHQQAANRVILGSHVNAGDPALVERLAQSSALLAGEGLDRLAAGRAALGLLGRAVGEQAAVLAFDSAFFAVAALFVVAAPLLVCIKVILARRAQHSR
ncbi:MFS transporter [Pseudomonas sp. zfem002]|nr:MFS transporter [Pseudomonas sp. zfem002]MDU9389036.1 MFS transporter [Pseudomonas sp. zfem002]